MKIRLPKKLKKIVFLGKSGWALAECEWRAASSGQKTLRLQRAPLSPLMTPTTDLGLSIRLSMFELRETGDWDIVLGLPERARVETSGSDQCVLKRRELPVFARVNKVTSASLGYPVSVSNKNSTLKKNVHYLQEEPKKKNLKNTPSCSMYAVVSQVILDWHKFLFQGHHCD